MLLHDLWSALVMQRGSVGAVRIFANDAARKRLALEAQMALVAYLVTFTDDLCRVIGICGISIEPLPSRDGDEPVVIVASSDHKNIWDISGKVSPGE